jgi:hypothetical protein
VIDWSQVITRADEIVREYDTAVTLRQLHYRLVSEAVGGYTNTISAYKRLSELSAKARRRGSFPPLVDLTRSISAAPSWESPQAMLAQMVELYRRDRTEGQERVPVIVIEKATLTAQMYAWFGDPLGIKIVPLRGYSSESFDREVQHAFGLGNDHRVLYVGDHDPSGHDIERHAQEEFGFLVADWERVALTPEIVDEYDLPVAPGKSTDSRAAGFLARHGELVQVEVEALDPNVLRVLIQRSLDTSWDMSAYDDVIEREEAEREALRGLSA